MKRWGLIVLIILALCLLLALMFRAGLPYGSTSMPEAQTIYLPLPIKE